MALRAYLCVYRHPTPAAEAKPKPGPRLIRLNDYLQDV
jgi:hypothetical protein